MPSEMIRGLSRSAAGQAKRKEVAKKAAEKSPARAQVIKPKLGVTEEVISPEQAALYLERNKRQRSIRDKKVDQYADDMRNNRWQLNGSTIVFDKNEDLLDGQHRLWACFQAGVPFRTLVARNVDPEAFHTIDTGMPRPATDIFTIAGESNVGALSAATRLLWRFKNGLIGVESKFSVSSQELLNFLDQHQRLRDSVEKISHIPHIKRLMTPSGAAFTFYLIWEKAGNVAAEEFLSKLGKGENLSADNPIFRAREALVNSLGKRANRRSEWASAIVIKAWNAHRKGKKVTVLSWSPTKNEEFPKPII